VGIEVAAVVIAGLMLSLNGLLSGTAARGAEALPPPPPCSDRVRKLADALSDRPELMDIKRRLAKAAVLCSDGKNDEANEQLSRIERTLRGEHPESPAAPAPPTTGKH